MKVIGHTFTSSITIVPEQEVVIKTVIPNKEILFGCAKREVYWLNHIKGYMVPKLLYVNGVVMIMQYVGSELGVHNAPDDMEKQLEDILKMLKLFECCHNDIRPPNLCVHHDLISLIDFGWATKEGEKVPDRWPIDLGSVFKGDQGFNDEHSVEKVIGWINQQR